MSLLDRYLIVALVVLFAILLVLYAVTRFERRRTEPTGYAVRDGQHRAANLPPLFPCRLCDQPWPCDTARATLAAVEDRVGRELSAAMKRLADEATGPHRAMDPEEVRDVR